MPSIFSHAIIPLAAGAAAGRKRIPPRLAVAGALLAIAPDFDVIGFRLGIGYGDIWGHRGATHSLAFALLVSIAVVLLWREARTIPRWLFLFAAMASHGLLDMLTDGGKGVALLWPFDAARLFLPWQPIRVSPIGARFFSERGLETVRSELLMIWLPCLLIVALSLFRRRRARS
ncbi:MAG: metal-dependent hydrolase [Sphingobium sp.]|nr:metal-dependent hydrolase [Sphingobium sp.]